MKRNIGVIVSFSLCCSLLAACGDSGVIDATTHAEGVAAKADDGDRGPAVACSFDNRWLFDDSHALAEVSTGADELTIDDAERLDPTTTAQLIAAAVHLQAVEAGADLRTVFDNVDDRTILLHQVVVEDRGFDWVQLFLGDTEVGVVFAEQSLVIVAEIGDGDISGCAADPRDGTDPGEPGCDAVLSCHWDHSWHAETSADLKDAVVNSQTLNTFTKLSELSERQLVTAALHLQAIDHGEGVDAALDADDEGEWRVSRVEFGADAFDWYRAFMGDTEVGVVFATGTTDIVAEIGDGDVMGCITDAVCGDEPTEPGGDEPGVEQPACHWDNAWVTDTSDLLWDTATDAEDLTADSELDGLSESQLVAAALHLQGIEAGDGLAEAFDAADEGAWTRSALEFDGDRFDWLQAWMGDTEVGVVFDAGTLTIVAEIGDGDVLGCL